MVGDLNSSTTTSINLTEVDNVVSISFSIGAAELQDKSGCTSWLDFASYHFHTRRMAHHGAYTLGVLFDVVFMLLGSGNNHLIPV